MVNGYIRWLIERGSPAEWWAGNQTSRGNWFTDDIHQVPDLLRFHSKAAAEAEARKIELYCGVTGPLRVVDHQFIVTIPAQEEA